MSKKYNQLSSVQRYQIEALLMAGSSKKEIAELLKTSRSTIYREIKRNTGTRGFGAYQYKARLAVEHTRYRHVKKPKKRKFTAQMKARCVKQLNKEKYSPKLISVMARRELGEFVSAETIYKWIWTCKHRNRAPEFRYKKLYLKLKHCNRKRKRGKKPSGKSIIPQRISIENRPPIVALRERIGDMEVDLMVGKDHKSAVLVTIDRATLKMGLRKLKSKSYTEVEKAFNSMYSKEKRLIKTITFDNDSAFICHLNLARVYNAETYFTRPYTSQDKGSVENRIGIIRRFLPKGTDLNLVSSNYIRAIENRINNRPVKKFNYKTPSEVFSEKIVALIS